MGATSSRPAPRTRCRRHVVRAAIATAVQGYKRWAADLGCVDRREARSEIIGELAYPIPVCAGQDVVPIAELSLNADMPLGAANGTSQKGVVAGRALVNSYLSRTLSGGLRFQAAEVSMGIAVRSHGVKSALSRFTPRVRSIL